MNRRLTKSSSADQYLAFVALVGADEGSAKIRLSERKFYQKITDIYTTTFNYDKTASARYTFFRLARNGLHFAVYCHTTAETQFDKYRITQDRLFEGNLDRFFETIAQKIEGISEAVRKGR